MNTQCLKLTQLPRCILNIVFFFVFFESMEPLKSSLITSYNFLVCFSVPHSRSKKILIPAALISRVIGRGGCNVNAIREHTAALIDIDTNRKKANGDCMVTIK